MSKTSNVPAYRPIGLACALIASGLGAPCWADEAPAAKPAPTKQGKVVVLTAAQALTVVRDPLSGVLRAPTEEERQALTQSPNAATAPTSSEPQVLQTKVHEPTGARGVLLGETTMSYVVVRRNADGTLTEMCVTGPEAAARAMKAPLAAKKELPRE